MTTHPLLGDELRSLRTLKREAKSPFIFVSERGAPFSTAGLAKLIERAGIEAKLPFKCHPHMLRHSTGYALANKGTDTRTLQAYLGPAAFNRRSGIPSWRLVASRTCGARWPRAGFNFAPYYFLHLLRLDKGPVGPLLEEALSGIPVVVAP